jgi:hypothetical protein
MAYDSARRRVVLFGGQDGTSSNVVPLGDTWEWDGTSWTRVGQGAPGPSARMGTAMAYDAARGRIVLFGGLDAARNNLQDTWEWDGEAWLRRTAPNAPSARCGHDMAFDPVRRAVVLFGGVAYGAATDQLAGAGETWEWSGSTWTLRATTGPSPRAMTSLVADPRRQRLVLFGGFIPTGTLSDTWEWNGASWSVVSATCPGARYAHLAAFDGSRVVLFGGAPPGDTTLWAFDGARWSSAGASFELVRGGGLVFDEARSRLVLFGGQVGDQYSGATYER